MQKIISKLTAINLISTTVLLAFATLNIFAQNEGRSLQATKQNQKIKQNDELKDTGIDETFSPAFRGENAEIIAADIQKDGKIIIAGVFSLPHEIEGNIKMRVARLNSDGTVDKTFKVFNYPNVNVPITVVKVQPDGKILVAYTDYLIRLNVDGSWDSGFTSRGISTIYDIQLYEDGKILLSGQFSYFDYYNLEKIIRLNPDGSFDSTFRKAWGNNMVRKSVITDDGQIYAALGPSPCSDENGLFPRINPDGTADITFVFSQNFNACTSGIGPSDLYDVVIEKDGNILISGELSNINNNFNKSVKGITRLDKNGAVLTKFEGNIGSVNKIYPQPDGKIITLIAGVQNAEIKRYFSNGTIDPSLNYNIQANYVLYYFPNFSGIVTQPDGKILVYGFIKGVNGVPKYGIVRLNTNN
ncbi:MAG: hypothetical protein LUM44_12530 [Pyrinomonadaceae bacterium]|nr:hypothetical protein [Pyrinomonadaceae bacterium]